MSRASLRHRRKCKGINGAIELRRKGLSVIAILSIKPQSILLDFVALRHARIAGGAIQNRLFGFLDCDFSLPQRYLGRYGRREPHRHQFRNDADPRFHRASD